jgi:hypothetical protein
VRFQEIVTNSQRGPLAIFDASGQLDIFVGPFLKFGITIPFVGFKTLHEVDLPEFRQTLIDFNIDASEVNQPILGSMLQGELTLHIGPRAGDRQHGNTTDGDETFTVLPGALANQVIVQAFGRQAQFDGVTKILADGGLGNDTITITAGVSLPVELNGGAGDDLLTAGIRPATLRGGDGNDTLAGGAANDRLFGDAGDDQLQGFGGTDVIDAGLGRDSVSGCSPRLRFVVCFVDATCSVLGARLSLFEHTASESIFASRGRRGAIPPNSQSAEIPEVKPTSSLCCSLVGASKR